METWKYLLIVLAIAVAAGGSTHLARLSKDSATDAVTISYATQADLDELYATEIAPRVTAQVQALWDARFAEIQQTIDDRIAVAIANLPSAGVDPNMLAAALDAARPLWLQQAYHQWHPADQAVAAAASAELKASQTVALQMLIAGSQARLSELNP